MSDDAAWASAYAQHARRLWALAYRMTGSAAEADDITQETFAQLVDKAPDATRELGPWLVRVCVNLARDRLRQRKRLEARYVGCWLPEPAAEAGDEGFSEATWVVRESASFAFLVALEALTPLQRAVLLLRDVFDLDTQEAAEALALTPGSVRTTLHRARQALGAWRLAERPPPAALHREAMAGLFAALLGGDLEQVKGLLAAEVRSYQDAGGAYTASTRIVAGPERVARLLLGLQASYALHPPAVEEVLLNGAPAWVLRFPPQPRRAPIAVLLLALDHDHKIASIYTVLHPEKVKRGSGGH